jgi:hypothetical protein
MVEAPTSQWPPPPPPPNSHPVGSRSLGSRSHAVTGRHTTPHGGGCGAAGPVRPPEARRRCVGQPRPPPAPVLSRVPDGGGGEGVGARWKLPPKSPSSSTPSFYSSLTLSRLAGLGGLLDPHRILSLGRVFPIDPDADTVPSPPLPLPPPPPLPPASFIEDPTIMPRAEQPVVVVLASAALPSATVAPPPPVVAMREEADAAAAGWRAGCEAWWFARVASVHVGPTCQREGVEAMLGRGRSEGVCGRLFFVCFSCRFAHNN